ncbi:MAG TPA: hypothetical protein VFQ45_04400 [Longimicrobium sp.]|nr:hypothetical protein [Longimicrobium sp.]
MVTMDVIAVPFTYNYLVQPEFTFMEVRGVLRTGPEGLVIEFRDHPVVAGVNPPHDRGVRSVAVPWDQVQSLALRDRFLRRPLLVLRVASMFAVAALPGVDGTEVAMVIARADRMLARHAAAEVEAAMAEHRLRTLGAGDEASRLPPR